METRTRETLHRLNPQNCKTQQLAPLLTNDTESALRQHQEQVARDYLEETAEDPWSQNFHALARKIEALSPHKPRVGNATNLPDECAIFHQALQLGFVPSAINEIRARSPRNADAPLADIEVNFTGLLGINGALPLPYSDYISSRSNGVPHPDRIELGRDQISQNRRDTSLRDFIDIFNHRFIAFFHRAWGSCRKTISYDRPDECKFSNYIASFIGLNSEHLRNRASLPDECLLYFSGHLLNRTRHPDGLVAILSDYFECDVHLEENTGRWLDFPEDDRNSLGKEQTGGTLGDGIGIGSRVWDKQLSCLLAIGPLSYESYQGFTLAKGRKQGNSSTNTLIDLVSFYTNRELFVDASIILDREEVPEPKLGSGVQLGFSTWLNTSTPNEHARDLTLSIN